MLLALLAAMSHAQEVGAIIRPEVAIDLASDREGEDTVEAWTRVRAFARGDAGEGRWFLEVRAAHLVLVGDNVEGAWEASVGESGWSGDLGKVDLKIGNLVERWGKLDLLSQVDVINGRDLRAGPLTPQELQRLPAPMLVLGMGASPVRAELVVVPFSSADRFEILGTDWSVVRQNMLEDYLAEASGWEGQSSFLLANTFSNLSDAMADLDPSFRRGLNAASNQSQMPQSLVYNGDVLGRLAFDIDGLDAAVMGGNMRNRVRMSNLNPTLAQFLKDGRLPDLDEVEALQDGSALITAEWPRTWVAGGEFSTLVGPIGVRGEGVYKSHQVVNKRWFTATTTPFVGTGIGLDYVHGSTFVLMTEVAYERMLDAPNRTLLEARESLQIAAGARLISLQDRLEVQLGGVYHVQFQEYFFRPTASYRASDAWKLEMGAILLGGNTPAAWTLPTALTYGGGTGAYFSENDAITFAVSWIQ